MSQFLDYFTFQSISQDNEKRIYHDVTFLKSIGKYQRGDKADAIVVSLEFLIWEGDDLVEDITILH